MTLVTPPSSSPSISPPPVSSPPKSRLFLYLAGGLISLTVITIASLKIIPPLLRQKTLPLNSQNQLTTPTSSDETTDISNWKEYTDSQIGYSIKYPNEITILDNRDKTGKGYIFFTLLNNQSLSVQHLNNPEKLSPQDFYNKFRIKAETEHQRNNLPPVSKPIKTSVFAINGIKAFQFSNFAGDGEILHTYFGKENTIVDISFYNDDGNPNHNQEDIQLFRQILSTFMILGKNSSDQWKTGEAIDFKFQYPQGWHALSGVTESTRYFKLDPEPLYNFPEYIPFIEGHARQEKSDPAQTLETEINYFLSTTYPKIKKLDWKNSVFPGECYQYDTVSDMWGELKNNIECLLEITVPASLPDENLPRYIYRFSILNYGNPIEKTDPDLSITKHFIESIHP